MKRVTLLFLILSAFSIINAQNYCLNFSGGDDYAAINSTFGLGTTNVTVECWVFIPGTSESGTFARVGSHDSGYGIGVGNTSFDDSGNKLFVLIDLNRWISTGQDIGTGWHHVAFSIGSNNQVNIYLDGKNVYTEVSSVISASSPSSPSYIGAGNSGNRILSNGKVDEVRYWGDVRSESEIKTYMYKELAGNESNLVAYYKMSDGSGTTLTDNLSFGGTNGTITNATWQTSGAFAGPKRTLDFDGGNNYAHASGVDLSGSAITVEAWIYPRSFNGASDANISDLIKDSAENVVFRIGDGGIENNRLQFVLDFGSGQVKLQANTLLSTNQWYHVAGVYDGSSMQLYINGVLDNSSNQTGTITSGNGTLLLSGNGNERLFDGNIEEARIWSDARTAAEIRENMTQTLTGSESGLFTYYRFDEADGTTLYDRTSNGHNATLANMDGSSDWVSSSAFNTWIGAESTTWSAGANWSYNSAPGSSSNIGIYSYTGGNNVTVSGSPTVNNFVFGSSSSLTLSSGITVNGYLFVESDLDLNGQTVTLGSSALLVEETGRVYGTSGTITTTRTLSNISSEDVGGMGAEITTSANMGSTVITRGHAEPTISDGTAILRYYDITPTNNTSLDATLVFNYNDNELNSITEADLQFLKSTNSGTEWTEEGGSLNTSDNTLTLSGLDGFSRWTAGYTSAPSGSGTSEDPYKISTLDELVWISADASRWNKYYIQTANIDASETSSLNDGAGWSPIGNSSTYFTGTYDGQYYAITDLYINRSSDFQALIGYSSGTLKNLAIVDASIYAGGYDYSIATSVGMLRGGGIIQNCFSTGSCSGGNNCGGVVGYVFESATVSNCYTTASVYGGGSRVGGLIGAFNAGSFSNSYSTGSVVCSGTTGGLVGIRYSGSATSSYWDTETSGQGSSPLGTGYTTAQMKVQGNFSGWDFTNTWAISSDINDGYPYLKGFTDNITEPTTQVSNLVISNVGAISADLSWTNGNGESRMVFAREGNSGSASPVDFNSYHASIGFGQGTQIGSTGWYCVYSGNSSSVTVKNLNPETEYIFQVFECNGFSGFYDILTSTSPGNSGISTTSSTSSNLALNFDGLDDYALVNSNMGLGTAPVTVEFLVYLPTASEKGAFVTVGNGNNGYAIGVGNGTLDSEGNELVGLYNQVRWISTGTDIGTGWYHIAFTLDESSVPSFYINGNLVDSYSGTNFNAPDATTYIGCNYASGSSVSRPFNNGKLDEVRFWNVERTQQQISDNMHTELNGNESGLVAYYQFNTIDKAVLEDNATAGSYDGTLFNGAFFTEEGAVSALPVELTSFTAALSETGVLLEWQTVTEVDNYGFEIERSITGTLSGTCPSSVVEEGWKTLDFIPGAGNSNSPKSYSFTDTETLSGVIQYRLKQIDVDGSFEFSEVVEVEIDVPEKFELAQNYPNPFNPETTISFGIPEKGIVNLSVYDILGRKVCELVNKELPAGSYDYKFNAAGLATEVYFYRITVNDFTAVKKLILMK